MKGDGAGPTSSIPSPQEEEVCYLKNDIDRLREENGKLRRENEELKCDLEEIRQCFKGEIRELEKVKKKMTKVAGEEDELRQTIKDLASSLGKANVDLLGKEERISKLRRRIEEKKSQRVEKRIRRELIEGRWTGGKAALKILPEEIWEIILGKLSGNPGDLWNCSNTCTLFRKLLQQWSSTWLFEQAYPNLFQYLPQRKMMECRQVSKGWNKVVDNYLEEHPFYCPHQEGRPNLRSLPFDDPMRGKDMIEGHFQFQSSRPNVLDNPKFPGKPGRSPYIGRGAGIGISIPEEEEGTEPGECVWANLYQFLNQQGEEIYYLTLYESCSGSTPWGRQKSSEFYTRLLTYLPNLRRLTIEDRRRGDFCPIPSWLPPSTQLETMVLPTFSWRTGSDPLIPALLRAYSRQLRKLVISNRLWGSVFRYEWPQLKELHLNSIPVTHEMEEVQRLVQANLPNLKKLCLLDGIGARFGIEIRVVVELVQLLSSRTRLDTLRLEDGIHHGACLRSFGGTLVMPPSLKTLEVEHCGSKGLIPSYTFLLFFPQLENLHLFWRGKESYGYGRDVKLVRMEGKVGWRIWHSESPLRFCSGYNSSLMVAEAGKEREEEVVEVDKYLYSEEMYKSNIWRLLPRLKLFTYHWQVYTRKGYQAYCEKFEMGGFERK